MDPEESASVRALARTISKLREDVRAQARGSQASFRSVELADGPIRYYDADGNVVAEVGMGPDGNFITQRNKAVVPAPPTPNPPALVPVADGILIKCDGTFLDGNWTESIARVEIHHMPDATTLDADDNTQIGSIVSKSGGVFLLRVEESEGPQFIRLQTVNVAEVESTLSSVASATALPGLQNITEISEQAVQDVSNIVDLLDKTVSTRHYIF